jgi:hydrogenase nickel incorporation protein HypB
MAVFNKIDLLPHLEYDLDAAVRYARQVNPEIETLFVSAKTGQGMDGWYDFLRARVAGREAA